MIAIAKKSVRVRPADWKTRFEAMLPAIRQMAQFAFRTLPAWEREEAVSDVIVNAFCAFRRLVDLDKIDLAYPTPLGRFAISQYRSGRRVGTSLSKRDVLASPDRDRARYLVSSLNAQETEREWCETIADHRYWPVADQAAFRVDFPAWLRSQSRRDRGLIKFLSVGNRSCDAAERFGLSPARISQLRAQWQASWAQFHRATSAS